MSSNFPTSKDELLSNQPYQDGVSVFQAAELNNIQDAIDALQTKVGITSSTDPNSLDYKINRAGQVLQVVYSQVNTQIAGTTLIPFDNTIPQNTEGFEVMTLDFTPKYASSICKIDVVCNSMYHSYQSGQGYYIAGLFMDSVANAYCTAFQVDPYNRGKSLHFTYFITASSVAQRTWKVRIGSNVAGTLYLNYQLGNRNYSTIVISEIRV